MSVVRSTDKPYYLRNNMCEAANVKCATLNSEATNSRGLGGGITQSRRAKISN